MKLTSLGIPDIVMIEPEIFEDARGWFMESFNEKRFNDEMKKLNPELSIRFVQDNHSCSKKNVLRGLHYQLLPHTQGKLVRVIHGAIYDVVVDIRHQSPTFGCAVEVCLSATNKRMLWIPVGFAHGFYALEDETHLFYKTTNYYYKNAERSLKWDDPELNLNWPLMSEPVVDKKDQVALSFDA